MGDLVLNGLQVALPLDDFLRVDATRQVAGGGALLGRVREEPCPVEFDIPQELRQFLDVVVGLAGEADDEAGAEGGVGVGGADVLDQCPIGLSPAGTLHVPQQALRGVLEGQVEVGGDLWIGSHLLDQAAPDLAGIQVEEADHAYALHLRQGGDEVDDVGLAGSVVEVAAVGCQVLGNEHDLAHSCLGEGLHLGADLDRPTRPLLSPDEGDRTERARLVASLRHLHVGVRGGGCGAGHLVEDVHHGTAPDLDRLPAGQAVEGRHEVAVGAQAQDGVDLRECLLDLHAETLGHTAEHDRARSRLGGVLGGEDRLHRLPTGIFDESAGVDHDHVRLVDGARSHVARLRQHRLQLLGVDLVLGAAQGGQVVRRPHGFSWR